ncbi:MAG: hypothetical protein H2069_03770 [Legionella sp.]|nr:hypothetical protein [Legionella sp.]
MIRFKKSTPIFLTLVCCANVFADPALKPKAALANHGQSSSSIAKKVSLATNSFIQEGSITPLPKGITPSIQAKTARIVSIDLAQLRNQLNAFTTTSQPTTLALPMPDGSLHHYRLFQNTTMHPELAKRFPAIKTFDAEGIDFPEEHAKLDLTPKGFHAMIFAKKDLVFIDPYNATAKTPYHLVYYKADFISPKRNGCKTLSISKLHQPKTHAPQVTTLYYSCLLRTYRLALAGTSRYTTYFGGTVEDAMAGQVSTINRVNGIYENEIGATLQLIANNDAIIYTDSSTDPYFSAGGNGQQMLTINQNNVDSVIGAPNYDIGHVFDTSPDTTDGGDGIASLGSLCRSGYKAQGTTANTNPQGDPFDVDYVAHEIGHQFGGSHPFNSSCDNNREDSTAMEPGGGNTLMAYANACIPTVQNSSDPFFHGVNLQQIGYNITSDVGSTCGTTAPMADAPIINTSTSFIIPVSTPFFLTAQAQSAGGENDALLTFTWDQMDNQITPQPPLSTSTGGPNFKSVLPAENIRYFPNLASLASGTPTTWEVLSSVGRMFNFRVTVRSNLLGGSCNAYDDLTVEVSANAGPFTVTTPDQAFTWEGASDQNVTWDVANTDLAPINATYVDLLMSFDGGLTYPYTLAYRAQNNGQATVTIPNISTTLGRIMVRASDGIFFNISSQNLTVIGGPPVLPTITKAVRNPLRKTSAFVYYGAYRATSLDVYTVEGIADADITLDAANHRFVINNITTPKKVNISITITQNDYSSTTDNITIPGIL